MATVLDLSEVSPPPSPPPGGPSLRPREEGQTEEGDREGCILQPRRACWGSGCSRVFPGELGQAPWGVGPQRPRSQSLWPPGIEGPVRRALRGSALPVRAAGSRLRSLKHAARGWPGASSTEALPRGGNPISTPFAPLPPPGGPRHLPDTTPGFGGRNSAPPLPPLSRARCPPQQPMGHSSPPPGAR